jgi:hypothetical protein
MIARRRVELVWCRVWIPDSNVGGNRGTLAVTGSPTADVYCGSKLNPPYICSLTSNRYLECFLYRDSSVRWTFKPIINSDFGFFKLKIAQ